MAYGTEAGITLLLGGTDDTFYTSANIALAIAKADIYVDEINSSASDNIKTFCSDDIASEILKSSRAEKQLKGLASDGGIEGRAGKSRGKKQFVRPEIRRMLTTKPVSSFKTHTPNLIGE